LADSANQECPNTPNRDGRLRQSRKAESAIHTIAKITTEITQQQQPDRDQSLAADHPTRKMPLLLLIRIFQIPRLWIEEKPRLVLLITELTT
jgi:hypothetical protein